MCSANMRVPSFRTRRYSFAFVAGRPGGLVGIRVTFKQASSGVRIPATATFSHTMSFFSRCRFLPVDSAQACVHSGKEVSGTLLAIKISGSTAGGW